MAPPFCPAPVDTGQARPLFHCICVLFFGHCLEIMKGKRPCFVLSKNPEGAMFRPEVIKAL